jgi:hypothetical protein
MEVWHIVLVNQCSHILHVVELVSKCGRLKLIHAVEVAPVIDALMCHLHNMLQQTHVLFRQFSFTRRLLLGETRAPFCIFTWQRTIPAVAALQCGRLSSLAKHNAVE